MGKASCHQFPNWSWKEVEAFNKDPKGAKAKQVRASIQQCSHIGDIPTYGMAPALKAAYPQARFILSTRGLDGWLASTEKLINFWSPKLRNDFGQFHSWYYNTPNEHWQKEGWKAGFMRHHEEMLALLGTDVLILPIEMPNLEKLEEVQRFLGCKLKGQMTFARKHVGNNWKCKLSKDVVRC